MVTPKLDLRALDAVTVFGCIQPPNTAFEGVKSLAPGHYLQVVGGRITEGVYWDLEYPDAGDYPRRSEKEWISGFYDLMHSAVERRLKADVPVGIYLSGGGVLLRGLPALLAKETRMPTILVKDPLTNVVKGTAKVLEDPLIYKKVKFAGSLR